MNSVPPSLPSPLPPPQSSGGSDSEPSVHEYVKTLDQSPGSDHEGEFVMNEDEDLECAIDDYEGFDVEEEMRIPICPGDPLGDVDCWYRYFDQIYESEGFDIIDFPGHGSLTSIAPMKPCERITNYAQQALVKYNEEHGTKYKFKEVLTVNGDCTQYYNYYITFTVTNTNGEEEYFQAQVAEDIDDSIEFLIIRPKAKAKGGSGV